MMDEEKDGEATFEMTKKRKAWKWPLIGAIVVLAGLALYRGWGFTQKRSGPQRAARMEVPVQITPVVNKHVTYSIKVTGDILPLMQVDLIPKVSGYLERIYVNIGDRVNQGQEIAQIDRTDILNKIREVEAKVAQAKAQFAELETGTRTEELHQAEEAVKQAESRFENARLQHERVVALFKRAVISKKESDTADMDYTVAEAQLASSRQHLKLLRDGARLEVREASQAKLKEMEAILEQERTRLRDSRIVAPFQGEISRKYLDAGAIASPTSPPTPIVNLVHTATLKITANVLEKDIPLLKSGMKARIRVDSYPGRVFDGRVEKINSALDLSTRTLQAEIYIPNPDRSLKPGMFASVEVALDERPNALVVPREALIEAGTERFVFVVGGKQALRKPVSVGYEQDGVVEILKGLNGGDQVVIRGQQLIKDGSPVRIVEGS
jgi:HlyD family secretion protein